MVRLSGEPQLVVDNKVHCAAHVKVREGGESKTFGRYSLSGERCISMYLEIQNLGGRKKEEKRGEERGEGRGEEKRRRKRRGEEEEEEEEEEKELQ